jgi:threonine/homoserine/homoserine lactone efflux protein
MVNPADRNRNSVHGSATQKIFLQISISLENSATAGLHLVRRMILEQTNYYLTGIFIAYGIFALGMLSPGPNILSIIGTSMAVGRKSGKALALGVASGSLLWGLLAWLGLTTALGLYASLLTVIKFLGATYLLWLAIVAFRSAASPRAAEPEHLAISGNALAYYRRGLLIQMTNPKAALTWTAVMSLGVDASAPMWVGGVIVFGTAAISAAGHLTYAIAFSAAPMVSGYRRARR